MFFFDFLVFSTLINKQYIEPINNYKSNNFSKIQNINFQYLYLFWEGKSYSRLEPSIIKKRKEVKIIKKIENQE